MASLPTSLMNRLYEPDSLRNTDSGFEISVKNRLAPSTIVGVGPLMVDDQLFDGSLLTVRLERPALGFGRPPEPLVRSGSEVSSRKSLPFSVNSIARVVVDGSWLEPGRYDLAISFKMAEIGDITVTAVNQVIE